MSEHYEQEWERRAEEGYGEYAIAIALLRVAYQLQCLGNGNAATQMGAIEALGMHLCEKMDALADAIRDR